MTRQFLSDPATSCGTATKARPMTKSLLSGTSVLLLSGLMLSACGGSGVSDETRNRLADAFPKAEFDRIYPVDGTPLLAGESGETIIYFTQDARFALVGNVLDLETKTDITERRRRELGDAAALEAKAFGRGVAGGAAVAAERSAPAPARPEAPSRMDVDLPDANLVVHNAGGADVIHVVSDYNCSFCKRLHAELEGMDVEIREIPVSYLGQQSGLKAASALCADDPAGAAKAFLNGEGGTSITTCTEGEDIVAANTAWAQGQGISGTPFIILPDGSTQPGYVPAAQLKALVEASS